MDRHFPPMRDDFLAGLVSGSGTLYDAGYRYGLPFRLVLADRPCRGYEIACGRGPTVFHPRGPQAQLDRRTWTRQVAEILREREIGLGWLAGLDTILDKIIFEEEYGYEGRLLNSHPSLDMKYVGRDAVLQTIESGDQTAGCTLHVATEVMDDPRFILESWPVPVLPGDTRETLHQRIKEEEWKRWPPAIARYMKSVATRDFAGYSAPVRELLERITTPKSAVA